FGRTWEVIVQADGEWRQKVEGLSQLKVRNERGQMVPLTSIAEVRPQNGPVMIVRYNLYPAVPINGSPAPGVSSGQAIERIQKMTQEELDWSMRHEWTELAMLQLQTGNTAMYVFI